MLEDKELSRLLGRLEGKVDGIIEEQRRIARYVEGTSKRVGMLEQGAAKLFGAVSLAAFVVSFLGSWVREQLIR
jgi:hypothetical protein